MKSGENRRARWDQICADATARGTPVESDLRFRVWIEEWISGTIEMTTVRERYLGLIRSGSGHSAAPPPRTFLDEIYNEVPEIIGLASRDEQVRHDTTEAIDMAWTGRN